MSSTKKKLTINATSSMMQVAFTALLYFFLYKYLLNTLGAQQLGVWSLILSFSSIANLANLGLTSGLVKFVAEYIAEKKDEKIGKLILTSFISLAILFFLVGLLILWGAKYFLHLVIDKQFLNVALSILPLSLTSLCVNAASGVFTSVLEGYQKNYLRNFIYVFSGIVMYGGTIILTPVFHLQGVAIAQLIQGVFILFSSLIIMMKINPNNRFKYWKWSTQSFKELFNYGYKFQFVSICQLLFEPTTKLLLSKFGGLAMLAHYEMANRLVNQCRALLVSANQVVIPVVAETVKTKSRAHLRDLYAMMNRIMLLLTFPLSMLLIILTPLISILWIGTIEINFTYSVYVLTLGTIFNIMSGPSYFSCMGEGRLNIPLLSHISMAIINIILGVVFGYFWGGVGIILAWGIALALGSMATLILYQSSINITLKQIYTKNDISTLIFSVVSIIASIVLFSLNIFWITVYIKTIFLIIIYSVFIIWIIRNNDLINDVINKYVKRKVNL